LHVITTRQQLAAHDGTVVEIEGVYAILDLGRYKLAFKRPDGTLGTTHRMACIRLADDTAVTLGARTEAEHALEGQRVRATGRVEMAWPPRQPPHVAQPNPSPWLLEIAKLDPIS
jgi:hypothetical protein